jgi:DNA-binding response OmpR family regulator
MTGRTERGEGRAGARAGYRGGAYRSVMVGPSRRPLTEVTGVEVLVLTAGEVGAPATGQVPGWSVLPALELLAHRVHTAPLDVRALATGAGPDVLIVDARAELAAARATCRMLRATGPGVPLLAVVTESGLAAVAADWGVDDVLLTGAGPAEVEARLRLAVGRAGQATDPESGLVRAGELSIDPVTYAAKLRGRPLDLTYKEFELLKFLAQHPGRVFTRDQLLREVWGYDYYGGIRTVDVHVRRLRAKLGPESESMIGTVRQVGYKFVLPSARPPVSELTPARSREMPVGSHEMGAGSRDPARDRATRRTTARPGG